MKVSIFLFILAAGILTYLPRLLPLLVLKNARMPVWFGKWMFYLPISIFASLIATDIFFLDGNFKLNILENLKLIPSLLTMVVAYKTKSMIFSILMGMISISLLLWIS